MENRVVTITQDTQCGKIEDDTVFAMLWPATELAETAADPFFFTFRARRSDRTCRSRPYPNAPP